MLLEAVQKVFLRLSYLLLAVAVAFVVFALAVWLPNLGLIWSVVFSDASVASKLNLPLSLLGSIATNFSVLSAVYIIAIALLSGLNVSFIVYHVRVLRRRLNQIGTNVSILGVITGAVGIGCAVCGTIILNSIIWTAVGAGFIGLLPLKGGEFGIIGVALLGTATYSLAKRIAQPSVYSEAWSPSGSCGGERDQINH